MAQTYGPQYPGIEDGLIFCFDPKNRDCWDGSTSLTDLKIGIVITSANSVGKTGAISSEGYFTFDGSDDRLTTPDNNALETEAVTIQCWVNLDGTWGGNYPTVFGRLGGASSPYKIRTYGGANSDLGLQIYDSTYRVGPKLTTNGGDISYDTWYFLSFSYDYNASDGQRFKVYLNGVFDSQSTTGGGTIATDDTVGLEFMESAADSNSNLGGSLGPCMIYNRELTAAEVLTNYNRLKSRFGL